MSLWFRRITENKDDLSPIIGALEYFQGVYDDGVLTLNVKGKEITRVAADVPGLMEYYNSKMFELDAIMKYIEGLVESIEVEKTIWYMTHYNRTLAESTAKRYASVHEDVIQLKTILQEVSIMRNNFVALTKGIDALHYQVKNVVTLRAAGFEDSQF